MSASCGFIRVINLVLRILQLCASVIILGIFSFFLAVLTDHDMHVARWVKVVEGIAGASTFYAILASILIFYGGGVWFLVAISMFLDFCFAGAFASMAIMTRNGGRSCTGRVDTPLGSGDAEQDNPGWEGIGFGSGNGRRLTYFPKLSFVCRLQKVTFAVSIIGTFIFLASIYAQRLYVRHRQISKRHSASQARKWADHSWWPLGRHRRVAEGVSTMDHAAACASLGSTSVTEGDEPAIPLTEKPQRRSRIFGRGKKTGPHSVDERTMARPDEISGSDDRMLGSSGSPRDANGAYRYGNGMGGDAEAGWAGYGTRYAEYEYSQTGFGPGGYAYGYGEPKDVKP